MSEGKGPVLVTGGTGFLGRAIVRQWFEARREVVAVARHEPNPPLPPGVRFRALDVTDAEGVRDLVRDVRPGFALHLAGCASPREAERDREAAFRSNTLSTLHLLDALSREAPLARVALASSAHVYGRAEGRVSESRGAAPVGTYASTKAAAEGILQAYGEESRLEVRILRFFNLIGPGQSREYALGSFASQVVAAEANGGGSVRVGDLDVRRDFLDVRDAARAAALVLERQGPKDEAVVNIGRGAPHPVRDLLHELRKASTVEVAVEVDPGRLRSGEPRELFADIGRLVRRTGFSPQIPVERSARDLLEEMRQRKGG